MGQQGERELSVSTGRRAAIESPAEETAAGALPKPDAAELLEDVRLLAHYAVETGHLPASVDVEALFRIRYRAQAGDALSDRDFATLVTAYQTLERRLGPVTVATLRATDTSSSTGAEPQASDAERYVTYLQWRTYINIGAILTFHIIHHFAQNPAAADADFFGVISVITTYVIPFLYGSLGADAALLRETTHQLHTRRFDPRRIPENSARFLLGTLSGGLAAILVNSMTSTDVLPDAIYQIGGAAVGFLAGYSNDFLFATMDRIIEAILPARGGGHAQQRDRQAEDEMLEQYRRLMDDSNDPARKAVLKEVVEQLESRRSG